MDKTKSTNKQETNGNGAVKDVYLPKDFEVDTSPTAQALMKAVQLTHRRLYPELYEKGKKRA